MAANKVLDQQVDQALTPEEDQRVVQVSSNLVTIDKRRYQIAVDYEKGFDREAFAKRYTSILEKYDFIVGDWGYEQLRLRGFYKDGSRRGNKDQMIGTLQDYLYEFCNFGCKYFVLECLDPAPVHPAAKNHKRPAPKKNDSRKQTPAKNRSKKPYQEKKVQRTNITGRAETVAANKPRKRHFTIRQRESNEK